MSGEYPQPVLACPLPVCVYYLVKPGWFSSPTVESWKLLICFGYISYILKLRFLSSLRLLEDPVPPSWPPFPPLPLGLPRTAGWRDTVLEEAIPLPGIPAHSALIAPGTMG